MHTHLIEQRKNQLTDKSIGRVLHKSVICFITRVSVPVNLSSLADEQQSAAVLKCCHQQYAPYNKSGYKYPAAAATVHYLNHRQDTPLLPPVGRPMHSVSDCFAGAEALGTSTMQRGRGQKTPLATSAHDLWNLQSHAANVQSLAFPLLKVNHLVSCPQQKPSGVCRSRLL